MNITPIAKSGFNVINDSCRGIKKSTLKLFRDNGKVLTFAKKIKKISNTALAFIKKNPRNIATAIGFASILIGVTTANPGLVSVGISSLVAATLFIPSTPSSAMLPPVHESEFLSNGRLC